MNAFQIDLCSNLQTYFECSITFQRLKKPSATDDGHTFSKKAIQKWFDKSLKSPLTGTKIQNTQLIDNILIDKSSNKYFKTLKPSIQIRKNQGQLLIEKIKFYQSQITKLHDSGLSMNLVQQKGQSKQRILIKIQYQIDEFEEQCSSIMKQLQKQQIPQQESEQKNQQMGQILSKIISGKSQSQICRILEEGDRLYIKLTPDILKPMKQNMSSINISQNSYQLEFHHDDIKFDQLVKHKFLSVQILGLAKVNPRPQQLQILLQHPECFPNLKLFIISLISFNNQHWKVLVQYLQKFTNLQGLIIWPHYMTQITWDDLNIFTRIKNFKLFTLSLYMLSDSSSQNLDKFQLQYPHIQIQY